MGDMVQREEIRWAYKVLLGREPENEEAYAHHSTHADFESLRGAIMCSEEGLSCLRRRLNMVADASPFDYFRPVTIFIHIPKTGGTAVHHWLSEVIGSPAVSDPHLAYIPSLTLGELNQLDVISGHFTFQEAMAMPRERKRLICCFRDPVARLISFYRFHRAHPFTPGSRLTCLAQVLTIEEFFAHEEVRGSDEVNNRYLSVLSEGGAPVDDAASSAQARRAVAFDRLGRLDAVLVTERMQESACFLARQFGYPGSSSPRRLHATDEMHRQDGFRRVEPIVRTTRLQDLLAPLVEHDMEIYGEAHRRLDALS